MRLCYPTNRNFEKLAAPYRHAAVHHSPQLLLCSHRTAIDEESM
jgi:hypothetical protein